MEEQFKQVLEWLQKKHNDEDITITLNYDLSGECNFWGDDDPLFCFDNLMAITKVDIDNWVDVGTWLDNIITP